MAKQLYGKNYADMSDKYRSKNTKQEFKDARREQRGDTMMNGLPQDIPWLYSTCQVKFE